MNKKEAIEEAKRLITDSDFAMIGSIGDGYPNIKAMLKMEHDGLKTFYFSTNTSSKRVVQFSRNPKSCVYFVSFEQKKGLMLIGNTAVLQDKESKQKLWCHGFEKYYPKGIDDPDYSVLRFTALKANYYHGLCNIDFDIP